MLDMDIDESNNKSIETIDKNSFGIYLFHSPLIYITYTSSVIDRPILVFIINFFIFGLASFLMSVLIRKIGLGFAMGEKREKKI